MIVLDKEYLSELAGAIIGLGIERQDEKIIAHGRFLDSIIDNEYGQLDDLNKLQKEENSMLFKFN